MRRERLISSLPVNLATRIEAGLTLGRVIKESRNNPNVNGVEIHIGEVENLVCLAIKGQGNMCDVSKAAFVQNEESDEITNKYGESSLIVSQSSDLSSSRELSDIGPTKDTSGSDLFGNQIVGVWKPRR